MAINYISRDVARRNEERNACTGLEPNGFYIRHPPTPHLLGSFITRDEDLLQTIHMGAALVDSSRFSITVSPLMDSSTALFL